MSAVKERPILMNAEMVRAILDGRKTQTRRIMKPQPSDYVPSPNVHAPKHDSAYFDAYCNGEKTELNPRGMSERWCWWSPDDRQGPDWIRCPYGKPGDRLWVRETFALESWTEWPEQTPNDGRPVLRVSNPEYEEIVIARYRATEEAELTCEHWGCQNSPCHRPWKPSIHMPRWASRILLEITDVRVQRVQEISEADAVAEGIPLANVSSEIAWPEAKVAGVQRFKYRDTQGRSCTMFGPRAGFAFLWNAIHGAGAWERNEFVWAISFKRVQP